MVIGSFITTTVSAHASRLVQRFWQNIKSSRWLRPFTAQIWHPVTSGFSQNYNHLWKGRDFRPLMRFRKIGQGSWWWLGKLCEVPRCLLWRALKHHCSMYNVSCIFFSKCFYFSYYMAGYLVDRPYIVVNSIVTTMHGARWVLEILGNHFVQYMII